MELITASGRRLDLSRPRIMGILNVTPDSFSDGGRYVDPSVACGHALEMVAEGADVIDVGGESTRPGSRPVPAEEQRRRVEGVIALLRKRLDATAVGKGVLVSVDTTQPAVAAAALDAGACLVNDIFAAREPGMLELVASRRSPVVLMHMQGTPATMQASPAYGDVVAEVESFLLARARAAEEAGVPRERIVLDPGIGFGKTREHNLALLAALPRLVGLGFPVLLGTSRKRFMGSLCARRDWMGGEPTTPAPESLVGATCATTAIGVASGVRLFRVHDVAANFQAAMVARAMSGNGA